MLRTIHASTIIEPRPTGTRAAPAGVCAIARAGAFVPAVAAVLAILVTVAGRPENARAATEDVPRVTVANVSGHESLRARDVLAALALDEDAVFDGSGVSSGVDSLLALLAGLGRPFATATVTWDESDSGVSVSVVVDEGPDVEVGELSLEGVDGPIPAEYLRRVNARAGSRASRELLLGDAEAILTDYADDGHPFAEVVFPRFVDLDGGGRLNMTVEVHEGPPAVFGDIVVAGNETTREHVIARETGLKAGEPFSDSRLASVRPRLERLPYLAAVDDPVVAFDPATGLATVGVEITEGTANRISGVLGLSGGAGGQDDVTGLVDIGLSNIAGTGRSAAASWEQIRPNQTEIAFSYTEPWVLGSPIDVGFAGNQSVRDTLYTTTEGDLLVTARMGDRTRLTWSLGAERYVPGAVDESTTTGVRTAFAAAFDGADSYWNPTTGFRLSATVEYSSKEVQDSGRDERSGTFAAEVERFFSVVSRQVLALAGRAELLSSTEQDVPFHELLVLGGARTLRGYREEQFHGTRVALGSVEYRFILGRRSRVHAFVDAGYWYREGPNSAKGTELGYGIGLRGDTRLGTISIDYGLGEGDDLLDGKLHVGLIREF